MFVLIAYSNTQGERSRRAYIPLVRYIVDDRLDIETAQLIEFNRDSLIRIFLDDTSHILTELGELDTPASDPRRILESVALLELDVGECCTLKEWNGRHRYLCFDGRLKLELALK